jgi:uncharacterized protein (DUF1015 family)
MPQIEAFRALRYDLDHVGSLSDVVAPPYDVIGPELQEELYKRHPANCIRLILNREEPGDDDRNNRYARAARFLKNWRNEGVLITEPVPAVYVYHTQFDYAGKTYNRRGFMARVRLERFGEGKIYPHEETMAGPKQDRLLLTRACKANLSQVFGLYPDPASEAQELLEQNITGKTPVEATDHLGVVHRLWPVTDVQVIARLSGILGPKPVFIADGHHRYETACNYRDELAAGGQLPANHPANYVLMMCVGMSDPGMIVLPTHRLFSGLPAMTSGDLIKRLGESFSSRIAGEGADLGPTVWNEIEHRGDQGTLGLYTPKDERWILATITDAGRARMAQIAAEHSTAWQGLGVAILHRLVIDSLLGAANLPKPRYVHLVQEVVDGLDSDEFQLAALVMPATVDHVRQISEHRERMPAKSTYFYPKLLSGLVFNPLE